LPKSSRIGRLLCVALGLRTQQTNSVSRVLACVICRREDHRGQSCASITHAKIIEMRDWRHITDRACASSLAYYVVLCSTTARPADQDARQKLLPNRWNGKAHRRWSCTGSIASAHLAGLPLRLHGLVADDAANGVFHSAHDLISHAFSVALSLGSVMLCIPLGTLGGACRERYHDFA